MSGSFLGEYLESQPGTVFNSLYKQPSTALAIFRRMLPHLAKTFVMAMLFLSHPLPVTDIESWIRPDCRRERDEAISLLQRLHIMKTTSNPGSPRAYGLTQPFVASLRKALTGGGNHKSFGVPCNTPEKDRVSINELDDFARRQWESVLGYMVGSTAGFHTTDQTANVSEGVKKLLKDGGLVKTRGKQAEITQEGFAFVLQDVNAQVWTILIYYLEAAETMRMDPEDVLSFLFMLGSLELGQDYRKVNLSPTQLHMLDDLSDFGLIYQTSPTSKRFYPTRLATTLTSDASALRNSAHSSPASSSNDAQGYIVIETNYRLYAYTTSPLQIAILGLFTRISTRYPNMVAGKVTRETIRRAVKMGITSEQIISYLQTHAHPQMRKNNPVLPPTVVDQIKLWQIEGERMKPTNGFLLKEFPTQAEYEAACQYAKEVGVLVWHSDEKRVFFVTKVEQMISFIKGRSKKAA